MNELLKRGFSAYKIILRNKLATSLMMLFGGIMLMVGAISGNGNDTKTLPSMIAIAGAVFAAWSFYKIGYIRAKVEKLKGDERDVGLSNLILQIYETVVYVVVCLLGIFLLLNENFTNQALNLMTGGFTIFNGVIGVINAIKNREKWQTFSWKFMLGLTIIELALGAYFIFMSNTINNAGLGVMGAITIIAGLIEVISSLRKEVLQKTVQDGKDIVKILKEEKNSKT